MLYLPRLFVYHTEAENGSNKSATFKIMEKRLLKIIMNPAMMAVWLFGILMIIANPALFDGGWMHVKLLGVVLMTGLHMAFAKWVKVFAADENVREAKFYRIMNEIPAAIMVVIVVMAVAEPF